MADSFKWHVADLERVIDTGLVVSVDWRLEAERTNVNGAKYNTGISGKTGLDVPEGSIIPYENLTEEVVLTWVRAQLNRVNVNRIEELETELLQELDELESPSRAKGKPWRPPVPQDGRDYYWNEAQQAWVRVQPPKPELSNGAIDYHWDEAYFRWEPIFPVDLSISGVVNSQ